MNLNEKDIKSVADFTKYAKDILKNAHGENYDDGIAQETVDGLVAKYGEDYGAMIGALTSGLGEELNEGSVSDKTKSEIKLLKSKGYEIDSYSDSMSDLIFSTPNEEEFINATQGSKGKNKFAIAYFYRGDEDGDMTISRDLLKVISSSFGKNDEIIIYSNAGVDLHSSEKGVFGNVIFKRVSHDKFNESKLNEGNPRNPLMLVDIDDASDVYDVFGSDYPKASDLVAYFVYGSKDSDNEVVQAIKYGDAEEYDLSQIMLEWEYNWKYNMEEIEEILSDVMNESKLNEELDIKVDSIFKRGLYWVADNKDGKILASAKTKAELMKDLKKAAKKGWVILESKLDEGFKKTSNWFELGGSELKDIKRAIESKIGRVTVELNDLGNYEFLGKDAIAFVGEGEYKMYRVSLYTLDHDIIFDDEGNDLGTLINKVFLNESKLNEGKSKHGFEKRRHQSKRAFDEFVNSTNKWSRDLVLDNMFGALEDEELIAYSNMFNDSYSAWTKEFDRQSKLKESKLNEGKKMQFEDVKVGFFTGTYQTIWSGDDKVESEMDYLNMEVADELKDKFEELDFIGFEFDYDDFNWGFEELFQEIPEYVSASFDELLSGLGIDGNVGKSRMVSPKFYNYGTDEIFCNVTIDYDLIDEAIADLVEYDDDYSLLQDLTRNNNTAYIYTNYGELESDLMRGDSLALEVLIQVLSEMQMGGEYEVRDEYEMSAYEEWQGNTYLGRTVSGNLELRLEEEIDDEEVVSKIVKYIEDNV